MEGSSSLAANASPPRRIVQSKGLRLLGAGISTEELRQHVVIPEYLRVAMADAVRQKGFNTVDEASGVKRTAQEISPSSPTVVFINSKSGGRQGPKLLRKLQQLISQEQVFDLSIVKPEVFFEHALPCVENIAECGDLCAQETCEKMRILVAGGDGTVGWILSTMSDIRIKKSKPSLPVGIIPLGTGNDLARSFGWGGTFMCTLGPVLKKYLVKLINSRPHALDSWQVTGRIAHGMNLKLPYALKRKEQHLDSKDEKEDGNLDDQFYYFEGVFYNYLSIGMDAQVAYGFHHLREKKPYLARGPITNKMIYAGYSCSQGWFCTCCEKIPKLMGINQILQVYVKRRKESEWEKLNVPTSVRAIVLLNLNSYASGRNPWGCPTPRYLEERGFVEANCGDGLIEIFALKHGWHTSFVMTDLINAKHLAQAAALKFDIKGSEVRCEVFLQMDGEPWKQPLSTNHSIVIEIESAPSRTFILDAH